MTEQHKEFRELFLKLSRRYSDWSIWNDFLTMYSISLANVFKTTEWEIREKEYLAIANKYKKEELEIFTAMFAIIVQALEEDPQQDFLGSLYHLFGLSQHQKGQYFTPYYISRFMSEIQCADIDVEEVRKKRYISINDLACGSGVMLISFANEAKKKGINYQEKVLFIAQDIDKTAGMMCYVQLSLLGCPAIVIIGNSLVYPGLHPDNDVWYTPFYHLNQWRFQEGEAGKVGPPGEQKPTTGDNLTEGASSQLSLFFKQVS